MKVSKRSVPMDALCVEDKGYRVRLFTHRSVITVSIETGGQIVHDDMLTVTELCSILMSRPKGASRE